MTKTNTLRYAASMVASLAFTVACSDAATTPGGGTGGDATGAVGTGGAGTGGDPGAAPGTGGEMAAGTGGDGLFGPGGCPLANCSGGAPAGTGGGFVGGPDPVMGDTCAIPGALIESFIPSGYADDYAMLEAGKCEVDVETCMALTIDPAKSTGMGYAGLFWLHGGFWGPGDAGTDAGCVVPAGMQVTFMARGLTDGVVVSFGAGGIPKTDEKKLTLTTEFEAVTVDLSNSTDLANMYSALYAYPEVPAEGTATFEIKDIVIEAAAP